MRGWRESFAGAGSRTQLAGWMLAAAFPVLALVLDKAASTIYAIFFLAGLWLLARGRIQRPGPVVRWILVAFAAYFLVGVLSFVFSEQTRLGEKLLGRDIRFLGALPVFFAFAAMAFPERLLRQSLAAGGLVTGLVATGEVLMAGTGGHRAGGETISIVFGHLAAALFALNLALAFFERRGRGLAIAASGLSLVAVVLSGTRGALLAVLAATALVLVFAASRGHWWQQRRRFGASVGAILLVLAAGTIWLLPRFEAAWQEYTAHAGSPPAAAARGCISDPDALASLARAGAMRGLEARIAKRPPGLFPQCEGNSAILLENDGDRTGAWVGPYRSLPEGATGNIMVAGKAIVRLQGASGKRRVNARRGKAVELPAVNDVERTQWRIQVPAGGRLWLLPVETGPGEFGFAASESSVGNRLSMFSMALQHVDANPLGRGVGTWPLLAAEEAGAGRAAWRLTAYDHPHSDYLTVLLERGWLGLAALLGVLGAPLAWALPGKVPGWRRPAMMVFVAATAVSALTETMFNHSIGITYYCVLVLLLVTARQAPGDRPSGAGFAVPGHENPRNSRIIP